MEDIQKMKDEFSKAITRHQQAEKVHNTIGTLGEKTLHSVLKYYYEPDVQKHEIRLGRYVADIYNEKGAIEIQTRNFAALREKLDFLLKNYPVTVIYPVAYTKWLYWIDEDTGEISKKHQSPKRGTPYSVFWELYRIKHLLKHPNLSLIIILLDVEEYRLLNGWSQDKKRGAQRYEVIPLAFKEQITIKCIADYKKLIPEGLPETYTSKDFKKASGLSLSASQISLNILTYLGIIERVGKQKQSFLYKTHKD